MSFFTKEEEKEIKKHILEDRRCIFCGGQVPEGKFLCGSCKPYIWLPPNGMYERLLRKTK